MTKEQLQQAYVLLRDASVAAREVSHHPWKCPEAAEDSPDGVCSCLERVHDILQQADDDLFRFGLEK